MIVFAGLAGDIPVIKLISYCLSQWAGSGGQNNCRVLPDLVPSNSKWLSWLRLSCYGDVNQWYHVVPCKHVDVESYV